MLCYAMLCDSWYRGNMEMFWKPFMTGKAGMKLTNNTIANAGKAMAVHIPRMDPNFPVPKRINAFKLDEWTEPFFEDMEAFHEDVEKAAEKAKADQESHGSGIGNQPKSNTYWISLTMPL